jgi:hypothetical protein
VADRAFAIEGGPLGRTVEAGGPLVPTRDGWLLRRVEGAEPWNLVPRRFRTAALLLGILPPVLLDLASAMLGGPTGLSFLTFIIMLRWSRPIADALIRRTLRAERPARTLAGHRGGESVLVRGRVRPGAAFVSAGGGFSAVLACYTGTVEGACGTRARSWAEVRGIDFLVDLESGESVVVSVRGAYLLAPKGTLLDMLSYRTADAFPAPLARVVRHAPHGRAVVESIVAELVVGPGDEVEVYGTLGWEVTPQADCAPGRAIGLCPVVKNGHQAPLVVHLAQDEDEDGGGVNA